MPPAPAGVKGPTLRQVTLLDADHRERQAGAGAVAGADGDLAGHRVGVEHAAAGGVRRRTLDPAELVRVLERERERAGVADRQALLQLELRGEAGGAVVRLVVQVRVGVDLGAVDGDVHLAVGPQVVEGRQRRGVRERQVDVLGHGAGVLVLHRQRLVLAGQHVAPGEGRVVDRGTAGGADLDLTDGTGHAAGLGVLEVGAGVAAGHEGQSDRGQDGQDGEGDTLVDASEDSGHRVNSFGHAL